MSDHRIEELQKTRAFATDIQVVSPITGLVLARNVSPGQRFDKGLEFYRIADISHIRVVADFSEKDHDFIKPGAVASMHY